MRREPNYLLLGTTVAVIAVLFFAVLLFLAGSAGWGRSYQKVQVRFAHDLPLPKLGSGAEITCGGVVVGKVKDVRLKALPRADDQGRQDLYVVVDAVVDSQLGLRSDCKIRAEGPPLGGNGTLVVIHRGVMPQALANGAAVEGLPPTGLNAVVGQLGDKLAGELDDRNPEGLLHLVKSQLDASSAASLIFKVNAIADDLVVTSGQIKRQLDPLQRGALMAQLDSTLSNVQTITAALRHEADRQNPDAMLAKFHGILTALDSASQAAAGMLRENRPAIQGSLDNVQAATAMIKDSLMPALLAQMDPRNPTTLLGKFLTAADKTNATLENLQQMSGAARDMLAVNQESIDAMVANLRETSEHLRAASREIRRNPWRLLYQPSKSEVRQVGIADAARSFSDAAARLDAAFGRLEAYVKTAGPALPADDPRLKDMQEHLGASLKNLTDSEKKFWELFSQ